MRLSLHRHRVAIHLICTCRVVKDHQLSHVTPHLNRQCLSTVLGGITHPCWGAVHHIIILTHRDQASPFSPCTFTHNLPTNSPQHTPSTTSPHFCVTLYWGSEHHANNHNLSATVRHTRDCDLYSLVRSQCWSASLVQHLRTCAITRS